MRINLKEYDQGFFIKTIREWSGLTQKEFANLLNKSEKIIQDYESGKVIETNGGVYESSLYVEEKQETYIRYWFEIK